MLNYLHFAKFRCIVKQSFTNFVLLENFIKGVSHAAKTDCPYVNRTLAVILQALNRGIAVFDKHNNQIKF